MNDQQEPDASVMISSAVPSRKKIKLTVVGLADRENFNPTMSADNRENSKLNRIGKWGTLINSKELLNSDSPTGSSPVSICFY